MASSSDDAMLAAVADAEKALRELSPGDFTEIRSYAKPPLGCLAVFEAAGALIDPSKTTWEWTDDKALLARGPTEFLNKLFSIDKDHLTKEQLAHLKSILDRDECQPDALMRISRVCGFLGKWLRSVYNYASARTETQS